MLFRERCTTFIPTTRNDGTAFTAGEGSRPADGLRQRAMSVYQPRSVHAALIAEAKAEGVSLNQLCVAKLIAQLRAVV